MTVSEHAIDYREVYSMCLDLVDHVLPALEPSQQVIYNQMFWRSLAVGQDYCRLSYRELGELTGLSIFTIKSAIKSLIERGLLSVITEASPRVSKSYRVFLPPELKKKNRLHRDKEILMREPLDQAAVPSESILDKLTPDDRLLLDTIIDTLPSVEAANLRQVVSSTLKPGEDLERKYRELVLRTKFGPARLKKYLGI